MSFNPKALPLVQSRDSINPNPAKVGEAAYTFLNQKPEHVEVGEMVQAMAPKYIEGLTKAAEEGVKEFSGPFYIVALTKKEPWTVNVIRQWFVRRQSRPSAKVLRTDYPLYAHDVWKYQPGSGDCELVWTLPIAQDAATIIKNADLYDPTLVNWIMQFNEGSLV